MFKRSKISKSTISEPFQRTDNNNQNGQERDSQNTAPVNDAVTIASTNTLPEWRCILCQSNYTHPVRSIAGNPFEIGLILAPSQWRQVLDWAKLSKEQTERRNATRREKQREADELREKSMALLKEKYKNAQGDDKQKFELALQIEDERLNGGMDNERKEAEVGNGWTMWLVPKKDNDKKSFNVRIHIIPRGGLMDTKMQDGSICQRKRDIGVCLSESSKEDWDKLRRQCMHDRKTECQLIDASGSLRLPVRLRNLGMEASMSQVARGMVGLNVNETFWERGVEFRLCVRYSREDVEEVIKEAEREAERKAARGWEDPDFKMKVEDVRKGLGVNPEMCREVLNQYQRRVADAIKDATRMERLKVLQTLAVEACLMADPTSEKMTPEALWAEMEALKIANESSEDNVEAESSEPGST